MLAKSLATEYAYPPGERNVICLQLNRWAPHSIRVNTLSPGYMHTDLIIDLLNKQGSEITEEWIEHTPMRRMGRPSELQGAVVWMASEASSFMTGANIVSLPFRQVTVM